MEKVKSSTEKSADLAVLQVPGLELLDDFISMKEERDLIAAVDKESWDTSLKRRTQHYGYKYNYQQRNINKDDYLGALPLWNDSLIDKFKSAKIISEAPQQLLVNEYEPGQGISKHIDSPIFSEPILTLSLGSGCIFRLTSRFSSVDIYLLPRTLVVLRGDARWKWTHEIPARKTDEVDGVKLHRGRRVSLTYRFVKKE